MLMPGSPHTARPACLRWPRDRGRLWLPPRGEHSCKKSGCSGAKAETETQGTAA